MSGDEQPDPRPKERSHADMTLGEAIEWALSVDSTSATPEELAAADALGVEMDRIAEQNKGKEQTSRVMFIPRK